MFKNYFKISWRNLVKDKQFTLLNIFGLSAGLACALLIFLWVSDELSYDKFFANNDRLYKLMEGDPDNGFTSEESSGKLSETVKQAIPDVEYASAVAPPGWFPQNTLSVNDKHIKANGQYAEKDYFNIFSFTLIDGNRNKVLADKSSMVISDELAIKLFGTTANLIGKPVRFDQDTTFFISGVFAKMPVNSSQQFDFVLSFDYFRSIKDWVTYWTNIGPLNYVLLKEGTTAAAFNKKVENIITVNTGDSSRKVFALKFTDVYLNNNLNTNAKTGGRIEYVNLFSILAVFILVIACINFMNLSTAKASRRFKEVGIKKVVGAERSQLIFQFLTESLLLSIFAMIVAVILAVMLLPAFNQLTGKNIILQFNWTMIAAIISIAFITGLVAGSYPALYISKFNPLTILKGKLQTSTAELLSRKGLVVFQFTLSAILIVAVMIIYQQIQFIQNTNPGYNKNNVFRIAAEGNIQNKHNDFVAALKKIPGVNNASFTYHRMTGHSYGDYSISWPGKDPENGTYFEGVEVGYDFIETMQMELKEGRAFSREYADSTSIILNETAVKTMQLKDPVGKTIQRFGKNVQVIGVVKDFHYESIHEAINPVYMVLVPKAGTIVASLRPTNQQATIRQIGDLYNQYNPGFPFTFNFLDEAYQKQYESETRVSSLSKYFAGLAIIISCLGLFGLAAFSAQKRRKEIGIRKVAGASASRIAAMLSKDFLKLVFIALCIAFPTAWWLMNNWLQSFAYRIHITPLVFILAGVFVIAITLVTVSFQSIKAAIANPVKSLRTE